MHTEKNLTVYSYGLNTRVVMVMPFISTVFGHISLCPSTEGEGTYCFWWGFHLLRRWRLRSLFEALYLLNVWMDSDQTCIVTSLGWGKTVIRL